jgi:hypothetical protein
MPKTKNIIIFLGIVVVIGALYFLYIKTTSSPALTVSSTTNTGPANTATATVNNPGTLVANDFLTLLLGVSSIKLNDSIFSDAAFASLVDVPIDLTPNGTEGRPNPFAPIGTDVVASTTLPAIPTSTNPAVPKLPTTLPLKP